MVVGTSGAVRYTAFLSYSHKDAAAAGRLHRRLETYRMPKRLVGTETPRGPVPERLAPIFRDRDELPAATDLSETVRAALAESGALIILCSPAAASSCWVAEEIRTFRALHPDRPILAAIVEGEPAECFPESIRSSGPGGARVEPLATDLRSQGDGPHLGLLKLIAGITALDLDALVQRDASRQVRRTMAAAVFALALIIVIAGATIFTFAAQREAQNQRAEAHRQKNLAAGQIDFTLADLDNDMTVVGTTWAKASANKRAFLTKFEEDVKVYSPEQLQLRASIMQAIAVDGLENAELAVAFDTLKDARLATAELLSRAPENPSRIFWHAQSEFNFGNIAYLRGRSHTALKAFEGYRDLAGRLTDLDRDNATWLREIAYADGGICTVLRERMRKIVEAIDRCTAALRNMERAASTSKSKAEYRIDLAVRHGELAATLLQVGQVEEVVAHEKRRLAYLDEQLAFEPSNARLGLRRVRALRALASAEANTGQTSMAIGRMREAVSKMRYFLRHDPDNAGWRGEHSAMMREISFMRKKLRQRPPQP